MYLMDWHGASGYPHVFDPKEHESVAVMAVTLDPWQFLSLFAQVLLWNRKMRKIEGPKISTLLVFWAPLFRDSVSGPQQSWGVGTGQGPSCQGVVGFTSWLVAVFHGS